MPTINEIMQYAFGKKNTKPLSINKNFMIDEDEEIFADVNNNSTTTLNDDINKELINNILKSFNLPYDYKQNPLLPMSLKQIATNTTPQQINRGWSDRNSAFDFMTRKKEKEYPPLNIVPEITDESNINPNYGKSDIMDALVNSLPTSKQSTFGVPITPTDVIASSTTKTPTQFTLDEQQRLVNPPPKVVQPMSILEDIQKRNKSLENRTSALNTAKVFDDVKSLLNNINEGDGLAPVESTHLISPEIKYDDTIRNKMVQESIKQSQIAQSNAMKMGMSGLIPAIDNNARRGMNEANAQAQTQINQIQQQNALQGANTANNEQQIFIQQRDKIIQDGIAKNAARYAAIGQSKESLYGDLQKMMEQKQTFDQEDIKARVYSYMQAHPSMSEDEILRLMQLAGLNTAGVFKTFNSGNKTSNTDEMVINNETYVKQRK